MDAEQPSPQPYEVFKMPEYPKHDHKWIILDVWQPTSGMYHPRVMPSNKTVVLVRCEVCELPQTVELDGVWTLKQVTAKGNSPKEIPTMTSGNDDDGN